MQQEENLEFFSTENVSFGQGRSGSGFRFRKSLDPDPCSLDLQLEKEKKLLNKVEVLKTEER
jgi:hypothetical protein